jgi:hypothetical protein
VRGRSAVDVVQDPSGNKTVELVERPAARTHPQLIFDGDCGFCGYWARYWQQLTGDSVDYRPYQQVLAQFPTDSCPAHRSCLSEPLALRLASHSDRRLTKGCSPRRHPRSAHAAGDPRAVERALCPERGILCSAPRSTDSTAGFGWEFQAVTAVVLGRASIAGGRGTVWRAMIGAIIIFMLANGLVRMGIPGYVTSAAAGVILLSASASM